jgi:hypothetical protein
MKKYDSSEELPNNHDPIILAMDEPDWNIIWLERLQMHFPSDLHCCKWACVVYLK